MKHRLFFFMAFVAGLLAPQMAQAYDFSKTISSGQTLYFSITGSNTVKVTFPGPSSTYPYGEMWDITRPTDAFSIPSAVTYNGTTYMVTAIGTHAFHGCSGITRIILPTTVTTIEPEAFYICQGLTTITIPNAVTSIGDYAFYQCTNLATVKYNAANCTTMGSSEHPVFAGCSALTTLTIGANVTAIPNYAFRGCTGLTSVTIGNSVTSIGNHAFYGCTGLASVTIPNAVTSIGDYAFKDCTNLATVKYIAANCTTMGSSYHPVFAGCSALTTLTIGANVTAIPDNAFRGCTGLTSVTIPNSVTHIGEYTFKDCTGLTTLNFNADSCISMGSSTYSTSGWLSGCTSLTTINIGNNVKIIPASAFEDCTSLTSVTIGNSVTGIGDDAFRGCSGLTSVTIPNSVTSIEDNAFRGCSGLTSVTIPNSVTYIEDNAFRDCTGLTSVTIPNSVTYIGDYTFKGCTGLTTFNFNADSCTSLGSGNYGWFSGCSSLTTLNIGNNVKNIPSGAFKGCTGLTSVTIPNSVTNIGKNVFSGCSGLTTLNFNADSCTSVYDSWLSGCSSLTTLNIGNNVKIIPANAFRGCSGLTSVTIPNSVTYIGDYAFNRCYGLTSVTIPISVTSIGNYAFSGCTGLTSVTIPNSVTSIGGAAFYNCSGLTSVTIPNSVTSIGYNAFHSCTGLTSVTIPNSVTSIEGYTFSNCSGLTSIAIPNSVTSIGNYAFYGCTSLTCVSMRSSNPPSLGSYAFSRTPASMVVEIPCGSLAAYQQAWGTNYNFSTSGSISSHEYVTHCGPYTWAVNGRTYNQSGVKTFKGTTEDGCITRDTLDLTIIKGHSNVVEATSCLPYYWDVTGKTYNKSGLKTFKSSQPDANGCYTYDTLRLNIIKGYSNTVEVTSCLPYYWDVTGKTYNKSGIKTYKTPAGEDGCAFYDTLKLNIIKGYGNTVEVTSCLPYYWDVTDRTYNKSGVKTFKSSQPDADGCYTYDTLRLNIIKGYTSYEHVENCGPYYWDVTGRTYNKSGLKTYKSSQPDADGCYTYDTLDLVVLNCDKRPAETGESNSQLSTEGRRPSVEPTFNSQLSIYPNPTTGLVHIDVKSNSQLSTLNSQLQIEVLDLVGRCVAIYENTNTLDLSKLAEGTYTLRITMPDGVAIRKVVKK